MIWWTIIIYLLILGILVILHELGHFSIAKLFHVRVDEFGIGFPPLIKKLFVWRGTDFVLNLIPLGGYVALAGETAPVPGQEVLEEENTETQALFYRKPAWQRFLVILAGPVANIIIAMVIFVILYGFWGIPRWVEGQVYIDYIEPDSPAAAVGLPLGARLVSLTDSTGSAITITQIDDAMTFLGAHHGQEVILEVDMTCNSGECDGQTATYAALMRPDDQIPEGSGSLGVAFTQYQDFFYPWYRHIPLSIYYGLRQSVLMTWEMLTGLWTGFKQLFVGGGDQEVIVMGPIGMVSTLSKQETFRQGLISILGFASILSLNLGIINLLPIPAVDGGRLVLILAEKIFTREKVARIEASLTYVGFALIILLMIAVTGADVWRLVTGG